MWYTALLLGLTGSLHCAGMCSPLAMAVSRISSPAAINRLLYNAGRILTYSLLGAWVSTFGSFFNFSQFQNSLSIVLGCACVLMGLMGVHRLRIPILSPGVEKLTAIIKTLFSRALARKNYLSVSFLGMLNGLLPCGLTALALTNCVILPDAQNGFVFMMVFGLGTLPVMLGLVSIFNRLKSSFKFNVNHMARVSLVVIGFLLISRSLFFHHPSAPKSAQAEIQICR